MSRWISTWEGKGSSAGARGGCRVRDSLPATVSRKWGGVLREAFTDADSYCVEYGSGFDEGQRAVILAAAISIDFFENNQGSDGVLRFGDRD
jgi:uncharacterized protein YxjI